MSLPDPINILKRTETSGVIFDVIKKVGTEALNVGQLASGIDAHNISFETSTHDAVLEVTGSDCRHDDDGGKIQLKSPRRDGSGTVFNILKRTETSGVVFTVISKVGTEALVVGTTSSAVDALDIGNSTETQDVPYIEQHEVEPYSTFHNRVHMHIDTAGNVLSDQKSRGGTG